MEGEKPVKKRRRIPYSCLSCRRRKVKCNRVRPICNRCTISNLKCEYDGPEAWAPSGVSESPAAPSNGVTVSVLNFKSNFSETSVLDQLPRAPQTTMSEHASLISEIGDLRMKLASMEARLFTIMPESQETVSFIQADPNPNSALHMAKKNRFICGGSFQRNKVWRGDPFTCQLFDDLRRYREHIKAEMLAMSKTENPNDLQRQVRMRKNGQKRFILEEGEKLSLKSQMEAALPAKATILRHVNYYLRAIHPFFPVLMEEEFLANVNRLVEEEKGRCVLHFGQKSDYLVTAVLLLVMRFSYQSLYLKQQVGAPLSEDELALVQQPINADVINMVNFALFESNFLRKTGIESLQALMLLRFYQMSCQEDGDGGDGTDGYNITGLICQIALGMGLNRPLRFPLGDRTGSRFYHPHNPRLQLLWQRLWWTLLELDMEHSILYGRMPILLLENSDHGPATASDSDIISDRINKMKIVFPFLQKFLVQIHQVREKPRVVDLLSAVNILDTQRGLFQYSGYFQDPYMPLISTISNVKNELLMNTLIFMINCYLMLHFERNRKGTDYSVTLQATVTVFLRNLDLTLKSFNRLKIDFAAHIMYLIHPMATCIYKSIQFLVYLGVRLLLMQAKNEKQPLVTDLLQTVVAIMRNCVKLLAIMGDQDYLCYRLYETYSYLMRILENKGEPVFNLKNPALETAPNLLASITTQQLEYISRQLSEFTKSPPFVAVAEYALFWPANETEDSLFQKFQRSIDATMPSSELHIWNDSIMKTNIFEDYEGLFDDLQLPVDLKYM
ncbi:hypothetical protein KL929_004613 [Ogataea haglerorum]|nr:hypothetical protein KL931_004531 [Ogataea haglerorum]KAG7794842.1 hypothetical protein KL929_004613 [Ogataea haglerorum]KAG7797878.1 hypothetical protein KL944_004699 [Ogataea haglerorum]